MNKAGVYETVGHCKTPGCGKAMLSGHAWAAGIRRPHHVGKGGHGMCRVHYARWRRHGTTERLVPRGSAGDHSKARSRGEVIDEYALIKDDVQNIRQAADRMGMTFSALDKALYRARLDGDQRAMPPSNQIHQAIARGNAYQPVGGTS